MIDKMLFSSPLYTASIKNYKSILKIPFIVSTDDIKKATPFRVAFMKAIYV